MTPGVFRRAMPLARVGRSVPPAERSEREEASANHVLRAASRPGPRQRGTPTNPESCRRSRRQRGFATLATVLLLTSVAAIVVLHVQLEWLAERQLQANEVRSAAAAEAAEAGLAWVAAVLSDPRTAVVDGSASDDGAAWAQHLLPPSADAEPGRGACRLIASGPVCRAGTTSAPPGDGAAFAVTVVRLDAETLRVDAIGCDGAATGCQPGATDQPYEAQAHASQRMGRSPLLRSLPAAALTVEGDLQAMAAVALINRDATSAGWLAATTGALSLHPASAFGTIDGVAPGERLLPRATAIEAPSWRLYGRDSAGVAAHPFTARIGGGDAAAHGRRLIELHAQGYVAFHVSGDLALGAAPAGTAGRPILLYVTGDVHCAGPCELHGLLHAHAAVDAALRVNGAVVVEAPRVERLPGVITYRGDVLATLRDRLLESYVALPGSWHEE